MELADAGATARISLLTRFPLAEPNSAAVYKFSNPWGLALSEDGRNLYLTDASQNCLLQIDTATGRWRRLARFASFPNPTPVGPPVVDAVPTSVRILWRFGAGQLSQRVSLRYGNGRVLIVNPATGARPVHFQSHLRHGCAVAAQARRPCSVFRAGIQRESERQSGSSRTAVAIRYSPNLRLPAPSSRR